MRDLAGRGHHRAVEKAWGKEEKARHTHFETEGKPLRGEIGGIQDSNSHKRPKQEEDGDNEAGVRVLRRQKRKARFTGQNNRIKNLFVGRLR